MNKLNQYKGLIWYGVIFLGLFIVIVFEAQFFYSKVQTLGSSESEIRARISLLQTRNDALSSLSPQVIAASKQIATVLPAENSVLLVTSQVRNAAVISRVTLKNLSTNSLTKEDAPGEGSTQVGVIVEGETASVMDFLASLTKLAPLIVMDTVNFITNPTSTIAQISLLSYWSPFPNQLPPITEPITALTEEETSLLTRLSEFSTPVVTTDAEDSTSSAITINTAPFAPVR